MSKGEQATVAVVSAGAMGAAIAARLVESGVRVLTSIDDRSETSVKRAAAAGMVHVDDAALVDADLIVSVVPPSEAAGLAERLLPQLARASTKPPYVDANPLAPDSKRALAARLGSVGCVMIDGSIIGLPPTEGVTGTTLFVSGPGAALAAPLDVPGFILRILDAPVGAASALKMCFSGINKGMVGLGAALLLAAEHSSVGEELRGQLAGTAPHLLERYKHQIPDMESKAWRWVAEMREIASFLGGDAAGALIFEGMAQLYDRLAIDGEAHRILGRALAQGGAGKGAVEANGSD